MLGWGFLATVALVVVTGGKSYYAVGYYPLLMAAGAIVLDGWLDRGHARLRQTTFGVVAIVSGALVAVLVLPVLPPATLARTAIPEIYKESAEQIGWPELVAAVERVASEMPAVERAHAVIVTTNYGEAGALELLGPADLPAVYSGHNSYWDWGPPPDDRTAAILVGFTHPPAVLEGCRIAATVDNGIGLANQEQGAPVTVCSGMTATWSAVWPEFRHLD
jgi:hypothetical protein